MGCYLFFCSFVKKYLFLYIAVQLRRFIFPVGKKFFLSRGDISTQLGKFYMPVFGVMPFCKVCLFWFCGRTMARPYYYGSAKLAS